MEKPSPPIENWATFMARLCNFSVNDQENIEWAYNIAKMAHHDQWRKGTERYFEHPRHVALITLDELQTTDPQIVIAALLHDVPEDTAGFGNPVHTPYLEWSRIVRDRVERIFGDEVAQMIIALTKPHVDHVTVLTKDQSDQLYLSGLVRASAKTKIVKMADRLHNARTLGAVQRGSALRKIEETRQHYYPIFRMAADEYPNETVYLMEQIEQAFVTIE